MADLFRNPSTGNVDLLKVAIGGLGASGAAGSIGAGISARKQRRREASQARELGALAARERRREGARLTASQRVAFAGAGVDVGSATPLDVQAQAARDAELDALRRQFQFEMEADQLRAAGDAALTRGILGGTGTILSTVDILRRA